MTVYKFHGNYHSPCHLDWNDHPGFDKWICLFELSKWHIFDLNGITHQYREYPSSHRLAHPTFCSHQTISAGPWILDLPQPLLNRYSYFCLVNLVLCGSPNIIRALKSKFFSVSSTNEEVTSRPGDKPLASINCFVIDTYFGSRDRANLTSTGSYFKLPNTRTTMYWMPVIPFNQSLVKDNFGRVRNDKSLFLFL